MGNKTSKVQASGSTQTLMSHIKHPKLFNSKLIQPNSQNQQPYLETVQAVQNKQIFDKWSKGVQRYSVTPKQIQTILVPKTLQFQQKGICGSSGVIKAKYAVLPFVLSQEILNRANLKQPFSEQELWYLIFIANMAGMTAHDRNIILGDVRPENILMSQYGQICVCCLQTFLQEEQNYHKTLSLKIKTFLSPQQIKDLQQGKDNPTTSQQVSQNFSIGLSVLSAVLLRNQQHLYGIDYSFDEQLFWKQLSNLRNNVNYSNFLKQVVEGLLAIDPSKRLTSGEVINILRPYEEQIISLESFQFDRDNASPDILQKLANNQMMASKGTQFRKVINNNDFNGNSRVQYAISPRGLRDRELQFDIPQNSIHRVNGRIGSQSMRGSHMGNANFTVAQSIYAPMQQGKNVQSGIHGGVAGIPQYQSQVIQSVHNFHQPGFRPHIQDQRLLTIPQPINNLSINPRSPQIFTYNSQIQSPQQPNFPYHLNVHPNIPPPHNSQFQMKNPQVDQSSKYSSNSYQSNTFQTNSQFLAQPQIQLQHWRKGPQEIKSGSLINHQFSNKLTDYSREVASIRPQESQGKDNRYETYESAMKNIDERLSESRRLFPENS